MAENLERRCSLSLKISNPATAPLPVQPLPILSSKWRRQHYSHFCLIIIKLLFNSHHVPSSRFLTLGTIYAVRFYHLSNLATCVIRVHVIGDFCHITCLLNPFYCTQHLVPRKREILTVSEFDEIQRGS